MSKYALQWEEQGALFTPQISCLNTWRLRGGFAIAWAYQRLKRKPREGCWIQQAYKLAILPSKKYPCSVVNTVTVWNSTARDRVTFWSFSASAAKTCICLQCHQTASNEGSSGLNSLLCLRLNVQPQSHWLLPTKNPQEAWCWKLLYFLELKTTHLGCIPCSDHTETFVTLKWQSLQT